MNDLLVSVLVSLSLTAAYAAGVVPGDDGVGGVEAPYGVSESVEDEQGAPDGYVVKWNYLRTGMIEHDRIKLGLPSWVWSSDAGGVGALPRGVVIGPPSAGIDWLGWVVFSGGSAPVVVPPLPVAWADGEAWVWIAGRWVPGDMIEYDTALVGRGGCWWNPSAVAIMLPTGTIVLPSIAPNGLTFTASSLDAAGAMFRAAIDAGWVPCPAED